ncbi:MAG: hypothetical protein U0353_15990 [Sandaracinus sp.]
MVGHEADGEDGDARLLEAGTSERERDAQDGVVVGAQEHLIIDAVGDDLVVVNPGRNHRSRPSHDFLPSRSS